MKTIPYHKHVSAECKANPPALEMFQFRVNSTPDGTTVKVGISENRESIKVICLRPIGDDKQTLLEFSLGQTGAAMMIDGLVQCLKIAESEGKLTI